MIGRGIENFTSRARHAFLPEASTIHFEWYFRCSFVSRSSVDMIQTFKLLSLSTPRNFSLTTLLEESKGKGSASVSPVFKFVSAHTDLTASRRDSSNDARSRCQPIPKGFMRANVSCKSEDSQIEAFPVMFKCTPHKVS